MKLETALDNAVKVVTDDIKTSIVLNVDELGDDVEECYRRVVDG